MTDGIEILVRDSGRELQAEITDYTRLELTLRHNDVGTWVLVCDASTVPPEIIPPGAGIVVRRDGQVLLSGVRTMLREDYVSDEEGKVADTITVAGVDDTVWIRDRLAFPGAPVYGGPLWTFPTGGGYLTYTEANASTVLWHLVDDNAGPSAISDRQVPGLVIAADPEIGPPASRTVRFDPLLAVLQEVALGGGDLGFTVVPDGTDLVFTVFEPVDRSGDVVFSVGMRNLVAFAHQQDRPTATWVAVGGQGEADARQFMLATGADAMTWSRIETFADRRDTNDATELAAAAADVLAQGAGNAGLSIHPIDTPELQYGTHYGLGDRVTVEIAGVPIVDVVREVQLVVTPDGLRVEPSILSAGQVAPRSAEVDQITAQLVRQRQRAQRLETRS